MIHQDPPVAPTSVFEDASDEPRGMLVRIDSGSVHVPEQVLGQILHEGTIRSILTCAKPEAQRLNLRLRCSAALDWAMMPWR